MKPGLLVLLLLTCAVAAHARQAPAASIPDILARFDAARWPDRARAFYQLIDSSTLGSLDGHTERIPAALTDVFRRAPAEEEPVRRALIHLLETENADAARAASAGTHFTEEHGGYAGDLVEAVASLRDARAVEALVADIATGEMASRGLAALGGAALDAVLAVTHDSHDAVRSAAVRTLGEMLDPQAGPENAAGIQKIGAALREAAADEQFGVRLASVDGLARLSGADVTALLQSIAMNDPYARDVGDGAVRYPVREAARQALSRHAAAHVR